MRINDAVTGGVLLVFAVAVFLYARTLPALPGQQYGAAVFPMLIACGLGGCGALLIVSGLRHWQGAVTWGAWARSPRAWRNLAVTVGLVVFYILAARPLGFIPVSIVILLVLCILLGTRWWLAAAVAAVATLGIYKSFTDLLLVPLPRGIFGP
jgi:putative tricarboxylic transport membrane protein